MVAEPNIPLPMSAKDSVSHSLYHLFENSASLLTVFHFFVNELTGLQYHFGSDAYTVSPVSSSQRGITLSGDMVTLSDGTLN